MIRGFDHGPLFQLQNSQPLTRQKLVDMLRTTLSMAGIDPTHYSGHSFRIGAATTAAATIRPAPASLPATSPGTVPSQATTGLAIAHLERVA